MTDKELKKLSRAELLELLIAQSNENDALKKENRDLKKKMADRELMLSKAGSIAEASLMLNGVFEAAQAAADQYLENIRMIQEQYERSVRAARAETMITRTQPRRRRNGL